MKEFDLQAAKIAADVWNQKKASGVIDEIAASGASMRTKIKIDLQILAVAMAANATVLYTEDGNFTKLADGFIPVRKMPLQAQTTFLASLDSPNVSEPPSSQSTTVPPETGPQP